MVTHRVPAGILLAAMALAQPGCSAGWHQPSPLEPSQPTLSQQVRVWRGGTAVRWHAVRIREDSISGIPFLSPNGCDSCRVSLPRGTVDSIQFGRPVAAFWGNVGLVVGLGVAAMTVACVPKGCPAPE
jgi:hypothetical protein